MMIQLGIFVFTVLLACSSTYGQGNYKRVCYTANWSQYKNGAGKFYPEYIDPSLCTHVIYAFAKLQNNQLAPFEWNDESTPWMKGMYERFMEIKNRNPAIKTLLAVGGWNLASAPFTALVASSQTRASFATQAIQFLRKHHFDGLDLDWEYPTLRGGNPADKQRFTAFVRELHQAFVNEAQTTGNSRLLLTAAVAAGADKIDASYEIPQMSQYLDFINVMSYDLHGAWETTTGHLAPLYPRTGETGIDRYLNVDWVLKRWVQLGAPKHKLIVGLNLYGRTFTLRNAANSGVGAPAARAGRAGRLTMEAGYLAYYEICDMINKGAQRHEIIEQRVPYLVQGDQWVGYDDQTSLRTKVDYIKAGGYGGIMVWVVDQDDFSNSCGQGKYPLLRAINDQLQRSSPILTARPPYTTQTPSPITTRAPTQAPTQWTQVPTQAPTHAPIQTTPRQSGTTHGLQPSSQFSCFNRFNGFYASPTSCGEYYICAGQTAFKVTCPFNLQFHPVQHFCDYPRNVQCQIPGGTSRPVTPAPTTQAPTTVATTRATSAPANVFCFNKANGIYSDPVNCVNYYICDTGLAFLQVCPNGRAFNDHVNACDFRSRVTRC